MLLNAHDNILTPTNGLSPFYELKYQCLGLHQNNIPQDNAGLDQLSWQKIHFHFYNNS